MNHHSGYCTHLRWQLPYVPFFILFNLCIFFVYGVMDSECEFMFAALAGKGVSKTSNIKVVLNGGQKLSFVRSDGSFALYPSATHIYNSSKTVLKRIIWSILFTLALLHWVGTGRREIYKRSIPLTFSWCSQGVPAGTHLLEVVALGYFFSPVMCLSMLLHCLFPLLCISCRTSAWPQPEFCSNF